MIAVSFINVVLVSKTHRQTDRTYTTARITDTQLRCTDYMHLLPRFNAFVINVTAHMT